MRKYESRSWTDGPYATTFTRQRCSSGSASRTNRAWNASRVPGLRLYERISSTYSDAFDPRGVLSTLAVDGTGRASQNDARTNAAVILGSCAGLIRAGYQEVSIENSPIDRES